MEKYFKKLQKDLKKRGIVITESTISMVLGAIVVLIISIFAYNYFKANRIPTEPATTTIAENISTQSGEIAPTKISTALPTVHVVQQGETLWSIAEKYYNSGYNFTQIAQVNRLNNPGQIEIGDKLVIPNSPALTPTTPEPQTPVITASRIDSQTYTVLSGDDLWNIAVRAYGDGYKWVDIAKANNLSDPNLIFSGNVLTIPR